MSGIRIYLKNKAKAVLLVALALLPFWVHAQLPDIPDLIRVTVDHSDNGVLIQWNPSEDTDIRFYQLYKMDANGDFIFLFAFMPSTLEYKHMTSGLKNLAYAVTALDSAGNESIFSDNFHRAVATTVEFDLCTEANIVQWTAYEGWEGYISGYKVFGGIVGNPLAELTFVPASITSFSHTGVVDNTDYIYYIETVNLNQTSSLSPLDTVSVSYPEAPSYLTIDHVNVLDEATVEIQYSADISGAVNSFRLLRRGNPGSPFTDLDTRWNVTGSTQVVQDQFLTASHTYQYLVESVFQPDGCGSSLVISQSNQGNSILLVNEINDQMLTLNWTPYETYESGLAGYIIQRMNESGAFVDIASVGPLTTQWQESIQSLLNGYQVGEIQYRVIALSNPNGGGIEEQSISNISTAVVETHMQVPSAFTPGSNDINSEFKPLMDFAPREYVMIVVDRGGRKMFETTDPDEGWDGRFQGGSFVNEAVYVYHIEYTDFTGLFMSYTGNVTVLYP
jgi:gliding motility-associated-like protein